MNVRPTRTFVYFLCFIGTSILLNLSCNKEDEYALLDAVLNKDITPDSEQNVTIQPSQTEEDEDEAFDIKEEIEGIDIREDYEIRTTTFSPIHDAYLQ
ncbi:MAG: hypothetical protein HKN31_01665, partial [Pricia sp.]|nr:hypothetical protein [Pricia sp.]